MENRGTAPFYSITASDIVDPRHDIRNYSEVKVNSKDYHLAAYRITNLVRTMFSADTELEYSVYCGMFNENGVYIILSHKDFRMELPDNEDAYNAVADKVDHDTDNND